MLQKCSAWRVLEVFFNDPKPQGEGFSLSEISRQSDLAHTSVKNHLQALEENGLIITSEKSAGERTYPVYSANWESEKFRHYKLIDTLYRIRESGLLETLQKKTTPDCIILFGSAARGEDLRDSDVDLYLQCGEKSLDLSTYEDSLKRNIQLHFQPDFNSYPPALRNNIVNGIVLYGYLTAYEE